MKKIKDFYKVWSHAGVSLCFSPLYWRLDREFTNYVSPEDNTFHVFYYSLSLGPFTVSVYN